MSLADDEHFIEDPFPARFPTRQQALNWMKEFAERGKNDLNPYKFGAIDAVRDRNKILTRADQVARNTTKLFGAENSNPDWLAAPFEVRCVEKKKVKRDFTKPRVYRLELVERNPPCLTAS